VLHDQHGAGWTRVEIFREGRN